jgi:hypothetical protein
MIKLLQACLVGCFAVAVASTSPVGSSGKGPDSGQETIAGNCIALNAEVVTDKKAIIPCDKMALQLIYQENKKLIISVIRTQTDGKFDFKVPRTAAWKLTSGSSEWGADVDRIKNRDGSSKVIVILKREKVIKVRNITSN